MQPTTSRDFQRAAAQRLEVSDFLLQNGYTLDAAYIAGYTVECSLKALILQCTSETKRTDILAKLTAGAIMHKPEKLVELLGERKVRLPLELVKRFRRITWSTSLRYETGRLDLGETRAFLKTAKLTFDWVQGQLP